MRQRLLALAAGLLVLGCGTAVQAGSLIQNGGFEQPALGSGWAAEPNGSVPYWYNANPNGDGIEIDSNGVFGTAYEGTQSMEVNGTTWDTISQNVTGLTLGQTYILSWAYGDRPSSGPQQMQVYFDGILVATNSDPTATNTVETWQLNSVVVTATALTETLSFVGVPTSGQASYGNEVDAVSLTATPEPSSLLLLGAGLAGLAAWARRRRQ